MMCEFHSPVVGHTKSFTSVPCRKVCYRNFQSVFAGEYSDRASTGGFFKSYYSRVVVVSILTLILAVCFASRVFSGTFVAPHFLLLDDPATVLNCVCVTSHCPVLHESWPPSRLLY